jgi:hypothetical protein
MIIFKKFQQKLFFICTIYPVYGKEKLNWPSLPRWSQFFFIFETYFPFLIFVSIFSLNNTKYNSFYILIPSLPTFYHQIHDFLYSINSFSKFNKFFIRVSLYQIIFFFYYVIFYHDSFQMYLVLQYLTQ